jgi:hypothetical protein
MKSYEVAKKKSSTNKRKKKKLKLSQQASLEDLENPYTSPINPNLKKRMLFARSLKSLPLKISPFTPSAVMTRKSDQLISKR